MVVVVVVVVVSTAGCFCLSYSGTNPSNIILAALMSALAADDSSSSVSRVSGTSRVLLTTCGSAAHSRGPSPALSTESTSYRARARRCVVRLVGLGYMREGLPSRWQRVSRAISSCAQRLRCRCRGGAPSQWRRVEESAVFQAGVVLAFCWTLSLNAPLCSGSLDRVDQKAWVGFSYWISKCIGCVESGFGEVRKIVMVRDNRYWGTVYHCLKGYMHGTLNSGK